MMASTPIRLRLFAVLAFLAAAWIALPGAAQAAVPDHDTGILVVVPDRGFLGNSEVRDAFEQFAEGHNAQLLFMVDERSKPVLEKDLAALRKTGATKIAVLPLVLSSADPRWQQVHTWLKDSHKPGETWAVAKPYGASYLAVEDLSARLRKVHTDKTRLLLLGYGANDAASAKAMAAALERMAGFASSVEPDAIEAVVYPRSRKAETLRAKVEAAIKNAHDTLVVPVAFAPRADSMMDFSNWFRRDLPEDAQMVGTQLATADALAQWMRRAANTVSLRFDPVTSSEVGVVVLAHGADWFWNRDIRNALAPVDAEYQLAWAFSMADPPVVERAVDKLEKQQVRAIVVVRAFSMASSFLPSVKRMLGRDVEDVTSMHGGRHGGHGMGMMMHHGMAGHASLAAAPRIRSAVPIVTVGGVGSSPLLARALLANARSVSKDPARETVILVAHGQGNDVANQRWLELLGSLAKQMRADGGDQFRAIEYSTWREDWPDKRKQAIEHVRKMVEQAGQNHGRVLIVPARINRRGRADRYLKGLDFGWSQGFAQTPYFAQWFEQEIGRGVEKLNAKRAVPET